MFNTAFIPVLGPSFQENSDDLTTASEFFVSEKDKLVMFQTRTPCSAALLGSYFEEMLKFIKDEKISEVVILTSTFAHEQHFIGKSPFEFRANEFCKSKEFPGFSESSPDFPIPGSGFALKFHQKVTNELQIPSVILYSFVSEGDNFLDAIQMCNNVNNYLKAIPADTNQKLQVKIPISWKFLFGRNVTREIY